MSQSTIPARLVSKAQYLSGNVRKKLEAAKAAASLNPIFARNVASLETVQPPTFPIDSINIRLGATWFPSDLVQEFISEVLGVWTVVTYHADVQTWDIEISSSPETNANFITYGVQWEEPRKVFGNEVTVNVEVTGLDLVQYCLDLKFPTIKRKYAIGVSRVVDPTLTVSARNKQELLQQRFSDWCKEDPLRAAELERIFNEKFNSIVLPQYDGSHLSLVGMTQEWQDKIRSRKYQIDGIYRGLVGEHNLAIWWEMGLGKMIAAIAICILGKQMGKWTKPVIVVQRSTLQQYRNACRTAFPGARVLIAREKDLQIGKRPIFFASIASGNYDCIIMTHQQFDKLCVHPDNVRASLEARLAPIKEKLDALREDENANTQLRSVKAAIRKERSLERQIENLKEVRQGEYYFEFTGIDMIAYDEAHAVKNETVLTKMYNVAGIPRGGSGRALDFGLKRDYLERTYGTGRLLKLTGTPINNSTAECYKELRDLCPDLLESIGIRCFDDWAMLFGLISTGVEIKMTGSMGQTTRFDKYVNIPGLKYLIRYVADIRTAEEEGVEKPELEEVIITTPMSQAQRDYMDYLLERAERIQQRMPMEWDVYDENGDLVYDPETGEPKKKVDNNLYVTTDGRLACQSMKLKDENAPDNPTSKIHLAAQQIAENYHLYRSQKATQVVFCDLGVPGGSTYNLYAELKDLVCSLGVPQSQVVFDHDYNTDDEREALDEALNNGDLAILITSSEKGGVGRNFHRLMIAGHLIDPTWGFIYDAQRINRIHRPGNLFPKVTIYRYITEGINGNLGFDSFMYQKCHSKRDQNYKVLSPDMSVDSFGEDLEANPAFSYAQLKGIASGNPDVIRLVEVDMELTKAKELYKGMMRDYDRIRNGNSYLTRGIPFFEQQLTSRQTRATRQQVDYDLARQHMGVTTDKGFRLHLLSEPVYTDPLAAAKRLQDIRAAVIADKRYHEELVIGSYGNFKLVLYAWNDQQIELSLKGPSGNLYKCYYFVQNAQLFANDRRLQRSYEDILAKEADDLREIAAAQETLDDLRASLHKIESQRDSQLLRVRDLELEKANLETQLGIDTEEKEAIIGESDDD